MGVPEFDDRHVWIQMTRGEVKLGDILLSAGDGVAVSDERQINLVGKDEAEILIFDLK